MVVSRTFKNQDVMDAKVRLDVVRRRVLVQGDKLHDLYAVRNTNVLGVYEDVHGRR